MKVYLSKINESWIVDRVRKEWYESNKNISTKFIRNSSIVWIISPWLWKKIPKNHLEEKKVLCSHYHFDFDNFDEKDFYELDHFVDEYHVISKKTEEQLKQLTDKKITSIPFWINQKLFYEIQDKTKLRKKFGFKEDDYLIGSFQRDSEGDDLDSPKLIKGPDIFYDLVSKEYEANKKIKVILAGKRRNFLINKLSKSDIAFEYFEMVDTKKLNELYNVLDLYIVSSRIEGGPQAILECAITKTPILSTDVGVSSEILHPNSIYNVKDFSNATVKVDYAFRNSQTYKLPYGMKLFLEMLSTLNEN